MGGGGAASKVFFFKHFVSFSGRHDEYLARQMANHMLQLARRAPSGLVQKLVQGEALAVFVDAAGLACGVDDDEVSLSAACTIRSLAEVPELSLQLAEEAKVRKGGVDV